MFIPSDRQAYITQAGEREGKHWIVVGPFGSGKTAAVIRAFLAWATENVSGGRFVLLSKTKNQRDTVILPEVEGFAREIPGLRVDMRRKEDFVIESFVGAEPNRFLNIVFSEGQIAMSRIRGMNLNGAYVDEATILNEETRKMLLSRVRVGADPRVFWSTNPDSPQHPFKTKLVDKVEAGILTGEVINTQISDNPTIPPGYVEELKAIFPLEHDRKRYIYGEWAAASGMVYQSALSRISKPPQDEVPFKYVVGMDWASKTVSYAVKLGLYPSGIWAVDEWRWDGRERGRLPEPDMADMIIDQFITTPGHSIAWWCVDQTSEGMILALAERTKGEVHPSEGQVYTGVEHVAHFFNIGMLNIAPHLEHLIRGINIYSWPEDPGDKPRPHKLKPIKIDDHEVDGLRYAVTRIQRPPVRMSA